MFPQPWRFGEVVELDVMDKSEGGKRGGVPVVSEHLEIYTRERVIVEDTQAHQGRVSVSMLLCTRVRLVKPIDVDAEFNR